MICGLDYNNKTCNSFAYGYEKNDRKDIYNFLKTSLYILKSVKNIYFEIS